MDKSGYLASYLAHLARAKLAAYWETAQELDSLVFGTVDLVVTLITNFLVVLALAWIASILVAVAITATVDVRTASRHRQVVRLRIANEKLIGLNKSLREANRWLAARAEDLAQRQLEAAMQPTLTDDAIAEIRRRRAV